jgi:hypothetical protein
LVNDVPAIVAGREIAAGRVHALVEPPAAVLSIVPRTAVYPADRVGVAVVVRDARALSVSARAVDVPVPAAVNTTVFTLGPATPARSRFTAVVIAADVVRPNAIGVTCAHALAYKAEAADFF